MNMENLEKQFIKAAKNGDVEQIKSMLLDNTDLMLSRDKDGSTALHCASWKGHIQLVEFLLGAGAQVNIHNNNDHWGTTPLHAAAHANQAIIVQLLIDAGAEINAVDMNGKTPLFHTTFHNALAAAKVLNHFGAP
jgi:ankyrin repeat protein